jgi:quinol-cytochrome oxidoreductase complex cytochrome b subunit
MLLVCYIDSGGAITLNGVDNATPLLERKFELSVSKKRFHKINPGHKLKRFGPANSSQPKCALEKIRFHDLHVPLLSLSLTWIFLHLYQLLRSPSSKFQGTSKPK